MRENGGGGELEVAYVLNSFYKKSVFLYHYKYLRKTHPGLSKLKEKIWLFNHSLWAPDESYYTNHAPLSKKIFIENKVNSLLPWAPDESYNVPPSKFTFFNNKIITLISAGCFSACETIASALKLDQRSLLMGSRTHGGSSEPFDYQIKGTPYSLNLPACLTWQKNGKLYEGVGVPPDYELLQDPLIKIDTVLSTAIARIPLVK